MSVLAGRNSRRMELVGGITSSSSTNLLPSATRCFQLKNNKRSRLCERGKNIAPQEKSFKKSLGETINDLFRATESLFGYPVTTRKQNV